MRGKEEREREREGEKGSKGRKEGGMEEGSNRELK